MSSILQNKKVLIAGGSSGVGLAVGKLAAEDGAKVIIASRNASARHAMLSSVIGYDVSSHSFDITSNSEIAKMLTDVGVIDHLVVTVRPDIISEPFSGSEISLIKKAFDTKFWGQYSLIQAAAAYLNPGGSIILTSGIAGCKIYKNSSTMAIINSATETLCKSLAVELAPLRVNTVCPGFIEPKSEELKQYATSFPRGRLATVSEIAQAYIYLMQNDYITGAIQIVDGGASLL